MCLFILCMLNIYLYICRRTNNERNLMRKKRNEFKRQTTQNKNISNSFVCVCVDLFDFGSNDYKHKFAMSIRHWFQQILNSFRFCMHLKPTICSFGCVRYTRFGGWEIFSSIVPFSNNAYSLWPYIHWSGTIGLAIRLKSLFMFQVTITIRNQHFRPTKISVFSFLFVEEIAHWRENPSVEVVRQAVFLTHYSYFSVPFALIHIRRSAFILFAMSSECNAKPHHYLRCNGRQT